MTVTGPLKLILLLLSSELMLNGVRDLLERIIASSRVLMELVLRLGNCDVEAALSEDKLLLLLLLLLRFLEP